MAKADNVHQMARLPRQMSSGNTGTTGGGDGPTGDDPMEARVTALEKSSQEVREKLVRLEMRLDSIESQMATKMDIANLASREDLNSYVRASGKDIQDLAVSFQKSITDVQKSMNEQTWKFISVAGVLAGLAFTAAKFIH